MIKFLIFLSVYFLGCFSVTAQSDNWEAAIPTVMADGFYKIPLSPQVLAKAKNQFNRLRIIEKSVEIPFLIKTESAIILSNRIEDLPVVKKKDQDSLGFIILENPNAIPLSSLLMKIKRVWISKKLKISGSNDRKSWFAVRSEFLLRAFPTSENNDETTLSYQIDIPLTDYKFYKVQSDNRDDLSLNVFSVGYRTHDVKKGELLALPEPDMTEEKTDEASASLFKFSFKEPYIMNRLAFKIEKPRFFQRNARLYLSDPRIKSASKKRNGELDPTPLEFFKLSSNDSLPAISLKNNSVTSFFVLIENQDNPPLKLVAVQAFQNRNFIQVYLEKGTNYTLKIGSSDLASPVYDLAAFEKKIDKNIPSLIIGEVRKGPGDSEKTKSSFFQTRYWIWLGLLIVAGLLIYMSLQMIKELKDNNLK